MIAFGSVRLVVPPDDHELPVTGSGAVASGVPGSSASKESRWTSTAEPVPQRAELLT